jgi:hypothetical protein
MKNNDNLMAVIAFLTVVTGALLIILAFSIKTNSELNRHVLDLSAQQQADNQAIMVRILEVVEAEQTQGEADQ